MDENITVIPIPGPSAFLTALSASGLSTDEFTFGNSFVNIVVEHASGNFGNFDSDMIVFNVIVGFLPKHAGSRKERLMASASETTTQIFYVPPHKLRQFLEESSPIFGESR